MITPQIESLPGHTGTWSHGPLHWSLPSPLPHFVTASHFTGCQMKVIIWQVSQKVGRGHQQGRRQHQYFGNCSGLSLFTLTLSRCLFVILIEVNTNQFTTWSSPALNLKGISIYLSKHMNIKHLFHWKLKRRCLSIDLTSWYKPEQIKPHAVIFSNRLLDLCHRTIYYLLRIYMLVKPV